MSEWQRGTIGELAKGYRGVTYSAGQLREFKAHDTVTLLRSNNISGGQLNFEDVQIVSERLVSDDQLLTPGDIAVCMSNGSKALVGKSAQIAAASDERFTVGAFCSVFRPQPSANSRFVAYVFQSSSYRSNLDLALAGTAINNLRNVDVEAFACDIPSYEEQRKIAQVLDTIDTAIRETEALIDKLKAVKQGLLHDLLTRGIDANGQLRPPQSEAPQLYKESPLGWIPREWECMRLAEKLAVLGGKRLPAGHSYADLPTSFKYLRVTDFFEREYVLDELENLHERTFKALERYEIRPGQLYISIAGSLGHIGVHRLDGAEVVRTILTENAARLVPLCELDPDFVAAYMNADMVKNQVTSEKGTGGGVPKLALFRIEQFWLAWPSTSEQSLIAERVLGVNKRISDEMQMLRKLKLGQSGLMDDLLTGRVRVTALLESVQQAAAQTGA